MNDRTSPDRTRWLRLGLLALSGVCALIGLVMVGVACFLEPRDSPRTAGLVTAALSIITLGVVALLFASLVTRHRTRSCRSEDRDG
ncbi:hypothetical protein NS184_13425 [Curtobacterium luteum]|uniref:Uncharacterized protein n=1 Tax=Curtobacterium luteum TaxID=33881 RepID=A0A175RLD1_9MICO|nr:hypothetical protein NS184_13425 [Curtobacterium luteum]